MSVDNVLQHKPTRVNSAQELNVVVVYIFPLFFSIFSPFQMEKFIKMLPSFYLYNCHYD